jgi:fructose-bisphosphate aldolase class II
MARIVVVTPNPAIDVTYRVDEQVVGETQRVREAMRTPGGKGLNVARVLDSLGYDTVSVLPLGGSSGSWMSDAIAAAGLVADVVAVAGETRSTVTVVDDRSHPTVYTEAGAPLSEDEWGRLLTRVTERMTAASMLVISGSFPPSTAPAIVERLVAVGLAAGVPVLVDTSGPALLAAARAGATILKPNLQELLEATGEADQELALTALQAMTGGLVVVSRGADGLSALSSAGRSVRAAVPGVVGNPTGAGDAATAGLAAAIVDGLATDEALAWASALGAAAVLHPVAGEVDLDAFRSFLAHHATPAQESPAMTTSTSLVPLLDAARAAHAGVGAFNVVLLEHAEAIVEGAERAGRPVILQISENCIAYHGGLAPIALACLEIARRASVHVVVHLDHIEDAALIAEGVALGVQSVMFDASKLDYAANVAATRDVVELCHAAGVAVEAELGEVGGKDGVHAPGARTVPADAAAFVTATQVDALAVAVGTSHAMTTRVAAVDHELIAALRAAVPVPLVLHGSSGLDDEELRRAVTSGMTKINISTHLNGLFTSAVRDALAAKPDAVDPRGYIRSGRDAIAAETARLLLLLGE